MTKIDRKHLTERATRVALTAREPRLRAFAHRLADTGLASDTWAEALGSFVLAKPPSKWVPGDESRAADEIDVLAATFRRVEAVTFKASADAPTFAVRVSLTRGDGIEACEVIHTRPDEEVAVRAVVAQLASSLPTSTHLSIAALSRLLWTHLERASDQPDVAGVVVPDSIVSVSAVARENLTDGWDHTSSDTAIAAMRAGFAPPEEGSVTMGTTDD